MDLEKSQYASEFTGKIIAKLECDDNGDIFITTEYGSKYRLYSDFGTIFIEKIRD